MIPSLCICDKACLSASVRLETPVMTFPVCVFNISCTACICLSMFAVLVMTFLNCSKVLLSIVVLTKLSLSIDCSSNAFNAFTILALANTLAPDGSFTLPSLTPFFRSSSTSLVANKAASFNTLSTSSGLDPANFAIIATLSLFNWPSSESFFNSHSFKGNALSPLKCLAMFIKSASTILIYTFSIVSDKCRTSSGVSFAI